MEQAAREKAARDIGITAEELLLVYRVFAGECREKLPQVENALRQGNTENAQRLLYTLGGAAASLYLQDIVDMLQGIGNYLKAGDRQLALSVLNGVRQAVDEWAASLQN